MQEFLKEVIVTFGDLLASLGFIVIGLLARRLWLVIVMALIWAWLRPLYDARLPLNGLLKSLGMAGSGTA